MDDCVPLACSGMRCLDGGMFMKSIKPGRGPSMLSGVVGIFMIGFGVIWTIIAAQAGVVFMLFGLLWTGIAITTTIFHFKNATQKKRYSIYDITDEEEEPDPLNRRFGEGPIRETGESRFCPYCGSSVAEDYEFCNSCGMKLPKNKKTTG